jgi:Protein of unknown function (DUF1236)
MGHYMTKSGLLHCLATIAILAGSGGAVAQTVGPDEAVGPNGTMNQSLALTPAQERAIYNAVIQQRVRTSTARVPAAIGAAVPQAVELDELPNQAVAGAPSATVLKYAIVEGDVVVVDPNSLRVVDVIHGSAIP